ncbi:MAG: polymer-forming cytoskeletal protein [Myxococcota bacterium]|nr:polymer-forming cytoskeletal protein [Myxococcota bacterium]
MSHPVASPPLAQRSAAPLRSDAASPSEPIAVQHRGYFEGLLTFRGSACVLGSLIGGVNARGRLRIGPDALVEGVIVVDELIVEGNLRGDVRARERVELGPRARVEGRLEAPRIAFRDGCRFRGPCRSGSALREVELP